MSEDEVTASHPLDEPEALWKQEHRATNLPVLQKINTFSEALEELCPYVPSSINNHIPEKWKVLGALSLLLVLQLMWGCFRPEMSLSSWGFYCWRTTAAVHPNTSVLRLEDPCCLESGQWACQGATDDAVDVFELWASIHLGPLLAGSCLVEKQ